MERDEWYFGSYETVLTSSDARREYGRRWSRPSWSAMTSDRFRIRNTAAMRKILELAASKLVNFLRVDELTGAVDDFFESSG